MSRSFDPIWEEIYGSGRQLNRYPFDAIVSFVARHRPSQGPVRVVELGCGAGNNLWFLAREGFETAGIDASAAAVAAAQERLRRDGLEADIRLGDFTSLPWPDAFFDLAIDRGALTHTTPAAAAAAVCETRRVLKPGGRMFFDPFASDDTGATSGRLREDGARDHISKGRTQGIGQITFYDADDIDRLFAVGWKFISRDHVSVESVDGTRLCEWLVVVEKLPERDHA